MKYALSKLILFLFIFLYVVFLYAGTALAIPLDLSSFSSLGTVTESGGVISFVENDTDAAIYFYNDFFNVSTDATTLSFDYDLNLNIEDTDYLQFNINYVEEWYTDVDGTGHAEIDLLPYQGQTVSMDWGLIWNFDSSVSATASVYNIDLAKSSASKPVPEPSTAFLLASVLIGFFGLGCVLKFKKTKKINE